MTASGGRRPFGLSGWLFWTITVGGILLLGVIPLVGPWLGTGLLVVAVVVWVRTSKPAAPFTVSKMDDDEDEYDED